jgi:hypothetical protein
VTAIVHVRGSFDKDEIEGPADTWLVGMRGQVC